VGLTDFDALSFDCRGALIAWDADIAAVLSLWAGPGGLTLIRGVAGAFARHEAGHTCIPPSMPAACVASAMSWPGGQRARRTRSEPHCPGVTARPLAERSAGRGRASSSLRMRRLASASCSSVSFASIGSNCLCAPGFRRACIAPMSRYM